MTGSSSRYEQGTCDLCNQELIRSATDCWHPYNVPITCPPEPPGTLETNMAEWQAWYAAGSRTLRPGREHFIPRR